MTHRTIALIHWHALHLWRRGLPFLRHGQVTRPGTRPLANADGGASGRSARRESRLGVAMNGPARSQAPSQLVRRFPDRTIAGLAERVGLAAAASIRIGHLTVVLPDGRSEVFGDPASDRRAEIRIHDTAAAVRLLLRGETGAGEAYMDGLWSSPDLVALIELAALNRSELALAQRLVAWAPPGAANHRSSGTAKHDGPGTPEHRGSLRPRQRLLPAVPRRDDDVLERGL